MIKILLIAAGFLMLGIGAIGIFLPVLPTVPFFFVASICFLKSSSRLNAWFRSTEMYRKHVERFVRQKGLTLKAKLCILIPVSTILIALIVFYDILAMRITIGVLLITKIIVFTRIKTIKETRPYDDKQAADIPVYEE